MRSRIHRRPDTEDRKRFKKLAEIIKRKREQLQNPDPCCSICGSPYVVVHLRNEDPRCEQHVPRGEGYLYR